MNILLTSIQITTLAGLASVAGGWIALRVRNTSTTYLAETLAAVAGFLLAASFLDLIPEVAAENPAALVYVLAGYAAIYLAENLMPTHQHTIHSSPQLPLHAGLAASIGLALHSFFDGVALAASVQAGLATAILLLIAVCIHQLPVGFGLATVMKASGYRIVAITVALGTLALATIIGGITTTLLSLEIPGLEAITLAFSAGSFIYIGATDMIPATHNGNSRRCMVFSLIGMLLFIGTKHIYPLPV
jgi:zinc transporter ZupT